MASNVKWLALGYNVPINPSKNRVYIWRKLKEYGAEYFKQGVAILPYNKLSYTRFKALSVKIKDMGGEASIIEVKFINSADEQEMISRFKNQYQSELSQIKKDCFSMLSDMKTHAGTMINQYETEQLKKMVKKFSKAKSRDYFGSSISADIENAILSIIDIIKYNKNDLSVQLSKYIEKTKR